MPYAIPDPLPWAAFAHAWERAENAVARLDETLATNDLREACVVRADFAEAAASVWLDGEAVALEELVLHDADTAPSLPSPALFKARAVLLARRLVARRTPAEVLTADAVRDLQNRRRHSRTDPMTAAVGRHETDPGELVVAYDPHWNAEEQIGQWLRFVDSLHALPALPAAALALHAWQADPPVQHGAGALGRSLIPVILRARNKTRGHDLGLSIGLRQTRPHRWSRAPAGSWLAAALDAIAHAAEHGREAHRRLVLARTALARPLAGRRRSSRLADLAELFLHSPMVSAPMAARHLGLTLRSATGLIGELERAGCIRELTGRTRYRAFSLI